MHLETSQLHVVNRTSMRNRQHDLHVQWHGMIEHLCLVDLIPLTISLTLHVHSHFQILVGMGDDDLWKPSILWVAEMNACEAVIFSIDGEMFCNVVVTDFHIHIWNYHFDQSHHLIRSDHHLLDDLSLLNFFKSGCHLDLMGLFLHL